jgi:hypothetical protein
MQIYLFQNGQQEGPFGLPRIAARLVSGDLDSATPAWREGMEDWHPLNHPVWAEAGIVAPPPKVAEVPVEEVAPASGSEPTEAESVAPEETAAQEQGEEAASSESELSSDGTEEVVAEAGETQPDHAFSNYREDDFKPPSYDEMEGEMAQLRAKRETFPESIGRQAFESGLRDEEIEEAWSEVEKLTAGGGSGEGLPEAFAGLGRAIMAAGITDPALDEVREEEQEISDRMLNLQMQLRRMGGGKRVKKPSPWRKWIILLILALFMGGFVTALVLLEVIK